jgi:cation diffusion facilitator CzcD-associated flavoprotein CzcO
VAENSLSTEILILGAGFSGLGMAIQLKKHGITDFLILERDKEVGGTWRDNHYPGAACDVPANLYSFSFEPNPDWSHVYARQPEIQKYILHCTDKYKIRPFIKFDSEVVSTRFDEMTGIWTVETAAGQSFTARFLVAAMGPLANPAMPAINGLDSFQGKVMHSARWDHSFDFEGKKVGVVGTGASSIQIVPELAKQASQLTVFQRTPPWIVPRPDREVSESHKRLFRRFKILQWFQRVYVFLLTEAFGPLIFHKRPIFKKIFEGMANRYRSRKIKDPELLRKTTPDYRIGCKRVLVSSDWYKSLLLPQVHLEDSPIEVVTPTGVKVKGGDETKLDALVLATGFHAPTAGVPFDIIGKNGMTLDRAWKDGAYAYKGMAISGFPNLFFLLGPNTGPGHTSVLIYVESQINYLIKLFKYFKRTKNGISVELRADKLKKYNEWIEQRMNQMVWTTGGCHSWYLTKEGKNSSLYPGFSSDYVLRTSVFKPGDYQFVTANARS